MGVGWLEEEESVAAEGFSGDGKGRENRVANRD
jgi:hypothetical protein